MPEQSENPKEAKVRNLPHNLFIHLWANIAKVLFPAGFGADACSAISATCLLAKVSWIASGVNGYKKRNSMCQLLTPVKEKSTLSGR